MDIARPHLQRLIIALIADTIGTARSRAVDPAEWSRWDAETTIDEDGVGIDSLGRLDAVARVNEFFHLHELGTEDYLVVRRAIGDWVEVVAQTLAMKNDRLTFATSGSSGRPKKIPHRMDRLVDEVDAMTDVLAGEIDQIGLEAAPTRVLAFAPPHHIYGFLFGVLLPSRLGLDVVDGRLAAPSRLRRASAGDLVVATPFIWRKLLDACPRIPNGVIGLSSSAPTPASVWRDASRQGLARLIEIYGSTETAGVGWRRSNRAGFALLPRFRRGAQDGTLVQEGPHGDDVLNAPDMLRWSSARRFRPAGRRDE
ncbi:MAG: AMP-binding protein, partial [Pseudomonadota bacterium]